MERKAPAGRESAGTSSGSSRTAAAAGRSVRPASRRRPAGCRARAAPRVSPCGPSAERGETSRTGPNGGACEQSRSFSVRASCITHRRSVGRDRGAVFDLRAASTADDPARPAGGYSASGTRPPESAATARQPARSRNCAMRWRKWRHRKVCCEIVTRRAEPGAGATPPHPRERRVNGVGPRRVRRWRSGRGLPRFMASRSRPPSGEL